MTYTKVQFKMADERRFFACLFSVKLGLSEGTVSAEKNYELGIREIRYVVPCLMSGNVPRRPFRLTITQIL